MNDEQKVTVDHVTWINKAAKIAIVTVTVEPSERWKRGGAWEIQASLPDVYTVLVGPDGYSLMHQGACLWAENISIALRGHSESLASEP